ncbi:unnamed protein product [Pieris macdunnoughi]|uniref:Uncharacterized protein n=1 Tax=Pieris macdunnoughi TaxID=345717 RepID=A0A821WY77_9NEOP|nr:unnamed protein product [Pieris macdunnoughi]
MQARGRAERPKPIDSPTRQPLTSRSPPPNQPNPKHKPENPLTFYHYITENTSEIFPGEGVGARSVPEKTDGRHCSSTPFIIGRGAGGVIRELRRRIAPQ